MAEEEYKRRNEDYYNELKNESYKAMLSKEVQASVAADQARKYTQNALNAQGLGTQGIAQSTQLGIGNQYRNALFEAQNQHEQNVMGFNQQQRAEDENDYRNAVSAFNDAYSKDDLDLYMKLGGYMDANGNVKQGVPQDIVDAYNAYAGRFATAEQEQADTNWVSNYIQRFNPKSYDIGDIGLLSKKLDKSDEIMDALTNIKDGEIIEFGGDILRNGGGKFVYYNGKLYQVFGKLDGKEVTYSFTDLKAKSKNKKS